ncbi:hypothetical protein F5Y18DRAFT_429156 [Xylariaceae sp. FL1019]|nr:hypothetical protein F5Y18DRAFT_429156 [Xylariaceae sp. FL1019]
MRVQLAEFTLLGLLTGVEARSIAASRTLKFNPDRVARGPAIPTSTLISDFKKNNVSASWAPGHPKVWGSEEVLFEGKYVMDVSDDQKFLAFAEGTNVTIRDAETQAYVSSFNVDYLGTPRSVTFQPALDDGYNVFVYATNYSTTNAAMDVVTQLHMSADATFTGEQMPVVGRLSSFAGAFSPDHQRFTVYAPTDYSQIANEGVIHDVNNPNNTVNLTGHTDSIMSSSFSPDGTLISTAAWDGYAKVWNASTGELLQDYGYSGAQNWLTSFSPDGKYLIVTIGGGINTVNLYTVANLSADPIQVTRWSGWIRYAAWSSNSKLLALGSYGLIQVWDVAQQKVVQRWEMEKQTDYESYDLTWIEAESGLKLAYRTTAGLEVYDFESNLKYRWGPDDFAQYDASGSGEGAYVIESKGWIGGADADQNVRFYKFPI